MTSWKRLDAVGRGWDSEIPLDAHDPTTPWIVGVMVDDPEQPAGIRTAKFVGGQIVLGDVYAVSEYAPGDQSLSDLAWGSDAAKRFLYYRARTGNASAGSESWIRLAKPESDMSVTYTKYVPKQDFDGQTHMLLHRTSEIIVDWRLPDRTKANQNTNDWKTTVDLEKVHWEWDFSNGTAHQDVSVTQPWADWMQNRNGAGFGLIVDPQTVYLDFNVGVYDFGDMAVHSATFPDENGNPMFWGGAYQNGKLEDPFFGFNSGNVYLWDYTPHQFTYREKHIFTSPIHTNGSQGYNSTFRLGDGTWCAGWYDEPGGTPESAIYTLFYDLTGLHGETLSVTVDNPDDAQALHFSGFAYQTQTQQLLTTGNHDDGSRNGVTWYYLFDFAAEAALTAEFTASVDASGRAVDFDASSSMGPIVHYAWDFGDAAFGVLPGQLTEGVTLAHTYLALTQYTITLTVTDGSGNTASVSHQVNLEPGAIDGDFVDDRHAFSGAT